MMVKIAFMMNIYPYVNGYINGFLKNYGYALKFSL